MGRVTVQAGPSQIKPRWAAKCPSCTLAERRCSGSRHSGGCSPAERTVMGHSTVQGECSLAERTVMGRTTVQAAPSESGPRWAALQRRLHPCRAARDGRTTVQASSSQSGPRRAARKRRLRHHKAIAVGRVIMHVVGNVTVQATCLQNGL